MISFTWLWVWLFGETLPKVTFRKGTHDVAVLHDRLHSPSQVLCYTVCDGYCVRSRTRLEREYFESDRKGCKELAIKLRALGEL
jgi:hypothetical protein